jgi:hypothetical protein
MGLRVRIDPKRVGSCKVKKAVFPGSPIPGDRHQVSKPQDKHVQGTQLVSHCGAEMHVPQRLMQSVDNIICIVGADFPL